MRATRFSARASSLRRLRTAFSSSPSSPTSSTHDSISPLSPHRATSALSVRSDALHPSSSSSAGSSRPNSTSLRTLLMLRHRPSSLDRELEEERRRFGPELTMLLEPRPEVPVAGGIFEVLDGRI